MTQVRMLRNCVAGRKPRCAGDVVELNNTEATLLINSGAAVAHVASVPETTAIESTEQAVLPTPKRRRTKK